MTTWTRWRAWFDARVDRPDPDPTGVGSTLTPRQRSLLAWTVARLQAGETGEGRIVQEVRRHGLGDADYQSAVARFVAEEGRHARLLGAALRELGGTPAPHAWTARAFTTGRRLIGPRTKLMALSAAEVVAVGLYDALAKALADDPLGPILAGIHEDEQAHVAFHADFFREALSPVARLGFPALWRAGTTAACAAVLADHLDTFTALHVDRRALVATLRDTAWRMERRVCDAQAAPLFDPDIRAVQNFASASSG